MYFLFKKDKNMNIKTYNNNLKKDFFYTKIIKKKTDNLDDLNDNNDDDFIVPNSPYITYIDTNKTSLIKNLRGKSMSNIIINNDINEGISENLTAPTTISNQNPNPYKIKIISKKSKFNDIKNKSPLQNSKPKKSVKFATNFATIIEIPSYKKYNMNKYYNKTSLNCSCLIF